MKEGLRLSVEAVLELDPLSLCVLEGGLGELEVPSRVESASASAASAS